MIMKNAVSYRCFNSGGPGGQHSNRSENAVEAILDPAAAAKLGIPAVSATASVKSQKTSKREAQKLLAARIRHEVGLLNRRPRFSAGMSRVRNYHEPNNRVTDETGQRWSWSETLGKTDLSSCIDGRARRKAEGARRDALTPAYGTR